MLDDLGFLFEKALTGNMIMGGESVRIAVAMLGTAIGAYFDLFRNRNIPNMFLYAFLAASLVVTFLYFNPDLIIISLIIVAFLSIAGYIFYISGQIGGADVFMVVSLALLLPLHPSSLDMLPNYPFILSIFIFSAILFTLYVLFYYGYKVMKSGAKPNLIYLLLLLPYAFFIYAFLSMPFFSPVFLAILSVSIIASTFFLVYRDSITRMLAQKVKLEDVQEEDVVAIDLMDRELVWKYKIKRLVSRQEIERLKKLRIRELWIYTKLPPFIPFLLLGLVLALLFSNSLLLYL